MSTKYKTHGNLALKVMPENKLSLIKSNQHHKSGLFDTLAMQLFNPMFTQAPNYGVTKALVGAVISRHYSKADMIFGAICCSVASAALFIFSFFA